MPDEAQARKARSEVILLKEGVPFIAHLPVVDTLASAHFRTDSETTERAICVMVAAVHGEAADIKLTDKITKEWGAAPHFTPQEKRFVSLGAPSQKDRIKFSWRYEDLWVLLWTLGFTDDMGRPDKIVDVPKMAGLMFSTGPTNFRARAKLRNRSQVLDVLDLTYRYHWAAVDARIKGKSAPSGLDEGVVMERHYALNWLTCYSDQDWDDISTDT